MKRKLRVGFPRISTRGGPEIFMRLLYDSFIKNRVASPRSCFLPWYDLGLFKSVARNFYNKPYVLRVDGIYYHNTQSNPSSEQLNLPIKKSLAGADGVIFQSNFSKALIEHQFGKLQCKSTIIRNGTLLQPILGKMALRKELSLPLDRKLIIAVAEWRRHKRLEEIIQIVGKLNQIDKQFGLIIVGDTPPVTNPDFIFPVGRVDHANLFKYYQSSDLCLHLCWLDNCPNTVVEAIANNVPVVCSNQGGTREMVEVATAGIVSECDKDIEYDKVDLNNPPTVDIDKLVQDVLKLFSNYEYYKNRIKRDIVDIDCIAQKYMDFMQEIWTGNNLGRKL